jgi:hypothetical protein
MVVTEKMKQPMSQQKRHFLDDWAIVLRRLAGRSRQRDDHIAKQARVSRRAGALLHREGKYVRRLVLLSVAAVEFADCPVVAKQDR